MQRGVISGGYWKFFRKKCLAYRVVIFSGKAFLAFLKLLIGWPFFKSAKLNSHTSHSDFLSFSGLCVIKEVAFHYGELKTLLRT